MNMSQILQRKAIKNTALFVFSAAIILASEKPSIGIASEKITKVTDLFQTAGVSTELLRTQGVLSIDPSELVSVPQIDAAVENVQEEAEAVPETVVTHSVTGYTNLGVADVDNYLNVRETPSESGKICGKLPQNAGCEILEETDGWYGIQSGNVKGYVKSEYVLTDDAAWAKAEEVKTKTATVTTATLYVREEMNTACKILTLVPLGEELEVLEEHEEWVKIIVDNDEGFISKAYVTIGYKIPKGVVLTELMESEEVSSKCVSIVEYAKQFLGNRYVWGGTSLTNGTDCSGFTMGIYAQYGVSLPHSSAAQSRMGTKVSASEAKPGDLFFYGSGNSVNHVAMYIGNGKVIHASSAKTGIKISNAFYRTPITVRRFLS